jgi:hypothetical protein
LRSLQSNGKYSCALSTISKGALYYSDTIVIAHAVLVDLYCFSLLKCVVYGQGLAALLEGPFANSILALGSSFEDDQEKYEDSGLTKCLDDQEQRLVVIARFI